MVHVIILVHIVDGMWWAYLCNPVNIIFFVGNALKIHHIQWDMNKE